METLIMLVSKDAIATKTLVSRSLTSLAQSFVSADLATRFNVRKGVRRSDYFRKGVCIPLSAPE